MAYVRKTKKKEPIPSLWGSEEEEVVKPTKEVKPKTGKKRVSSIKSEYDGIKFDSQLEIFCYKSLKEANLEFEYTNTTYTIVDAFECTGDSFEADKRKGPSVYKKSKKLQSIKYTPDFVGENWIIETKGRANELWPMRLKLFKKYLTDNNLKYDIYIPSNRFQVQECIKMIIDKNK